MKKIVLFTVLCLFAWPAFAQMYIRDQSVIYQQERMVFKQWDQDKFTPTHGFLWLNPLYWLTWAWHTDYHNTDRRPLSGAGPQTQRLALVAAMQNTESAYRKHADTLRNVAVAELINYNGLLSDADPLWLLYYSKAFKPLLNQSDDAVLNGLSPPVIHYLISSGLYDWYLEQSHELLERLNSARTTTLDRGARILAYYRMLEEYRKLSANWETKKQQAGFMLSLRSKANTIKAGSTYSPAIRSDRQIADDILSHSKL